MLAELTALWGFAFVQPVLDVFGRSPEQFVFRRADATTVVVFALALTIVPIAALWVIEQLGAVAHRVVGQVLHVAFVALLLGVIALRILKRGVGLTGPVLAVLAVALSAGATYLFVRFVVVRQWARYASLATVAFLLLFLFASPVNDILRGDAVTASGSTVGDPARVVMLVLDELPLASLVDEDGSIDASLYPNIAELAAASSWFRNATAVSPSTWHAVPSIATGMYPTEGAPVARDHPDSIFTMLGGSYEMDVTESITRLCPTSVCEPADVDRTQSLRRLGGDVRRVVRSQLALHESDADPVAGLVENPEGGGGGIADLGRDQPERFSGFLSGIRADEPPTLHYLHLLLPARARGGTCRRGCSTRLPRQRPGQGRRRVDRPGLAARSSARQRHLLQLRYVDRLVGDLLDRLRATDTFDDTLLVVTADHGIAFQPGLPVRGLETDGYVEAIHPDVMWVPMFVKAPGQARGRDARHQRRDRRRGADDRRPARRRDAMDARRPVGVLRTAPRVDEDVLPEQGQPVRRRRRPAGGGGGGGRLAGGPGPHRRHVPRRGAEAELTAQACARGWWGRGRSWSVRRSPTWAGQVRPV